MRSLHGARLSASRVQQLIKCAMISDFASDDCTLNIDTSLFVIGWKKIRKVSKLRAVDGMFQNLCSIVYLGPIYGEPDIMKIIGCETKYLLCARSTLTL